MRYSAENVSRALDHLKTTDPVMRDVVNRVGPFTLKPVRNRFGMLVRSIISQQISTKAARSIRERVEALVAPEVPSASRLLAVDVELLRSAGLSRQKVEYLLDLCRHVDSGELALNRIGRLDDEAVIETLTRVKGVGRWTAQMFLMFALGRLDVLPHDDLGVRQAIMRLYDLKDLPDKATCVEIAEPWRPYASVGSWYCWRSGEL